MSVAISGRRGSGEQMGDGAEGDMEKGNEGEV